MTFPWSKNALNMSPTNNKVLEANAKCANGGSFHVFEEPENQMNAGPPGPQNSTQNKSSASAWKIGNVQLRIRHENGEMKASEHNGSVSKVLQMVEDKPEMFQQLLNLQPKPVGNEVIENVIQEIQKNDEELLKKQKEEDVHMEEEGQKGQNMNLQLQPAVPSTNPQNSEDEVNAAIWQETEMEFCAYLAYPKKLLKRRGNFRRKRGKRGAKNSKNGEEDILMVIDDTEMETEIVVMEHHNS